MSPPDTGRDRAAGPGGTTAVAPAVYARLVKSPLDRVLALTLIVILSPLLAMVAVAVAVRLGRPILFRQPRAGRGGRVFTLLKFRTMTDACDANALLRPDAERLTPFGRFLRATSLDELPELFNVCRGEMSLVGPRPLLTSYLTRYSPAQARRLEAVPGLTGWAQIHGRNALSWDDKFALDVWYVDHVGLWLDLRILLATVRVWLVARGINQPGQATVQEFSRHQVS